MEPASRSKHHQVLINVGGASSFSFGWGEPVPADKPKGKAKVAAPTKAEPLPQQSVHTSVKVSHPPGGISQITF